MAQINISTTTSLKQIQGSKDYWKALVLVILNIRPVHMELHIFLNVWPSKAHLIGATCVLCVKWRQLMAMWQFLLQGKNARSKNRLRRINSIVVEDFVAAKYTAPRMVLAVSGVEHEELWKYAEPLLSDFPGGTQVEEPKSMYVGVDHCVMVDIGRNSFAHAFELPGASDVMLSFAAFPIEIPGEVVFLHPVHNYAIIAYDPSAHGTTGALVVRVAVLLPGRQICI
ncbi:unnamed protein product [Lactuca virosa]|uniref:Peptidase M16 C-terminal domain-containing protein n=1 Tax=Lactuca virosa TaxID=75947 RepID=A0AAU9PM09_9ASTR|nr:unnamed protein product [Lactuca virosa]